MTKPMYPFLYEQFLTPNEVMNISEKFLRIRTSEYKIAIRDCIISKMKHGQYDCSYYCCYAKINIHSVMKEIVQEMKEKGWKVKYKTSIDKNVLDVYWKPYNSKSSFFSHLFGK